MIFKNGEWNEKINVRDFIVRNYTPYEGDSGFLAPPSDKTVKLWNEVSDLMKKEREAGGVLDIDVETISTITSHKPGYIDKELETIVGLQTDALAEHFAGFFVTAVIESIEQSLCKICSCAEKLHLLSYFHC